MRDDTNFKASDAGCPSVWSLFCASKHCKPKEMPHSMIVWRSVKHDSQLYHSLGMYETHQIDNYLLVPALAISGTIRHVRKTSALVLDSGCILVRMTHVNQTLAQVEKHINKFRHLDYMFDQSDKLELCNNKFDRYLILMDLLVAQVAALIEHERINMIRTWENICRECQQLSRLYHWGIENFPHSSSHWLTQ